MLLARFHSHTIHSTSHHLDWDSSRSPVLRATRGDEVEFRDIDAMCGQISPQTRAEELPGLDPARINPVSGPVYVEGAEPGDSVTVTLLGFESQGWGWTAVFPDFGLLQRDFPTPAIHHWAYDRTFGQSAAYGRWAKVPLRPFCGTVGGCRGCVHALQRVRRSAYQRDRRHPELGRFVLHAASGL